MKSKPDRPRLVLAATLSADGRVLDSAAIIGLRSKTAHPVPITFLSSARAQIPAEGIVFATTALTPSLRRRIPGTADLWLLAGAEISLPSALAVLFEDYGIREVVATGAQPLLVASGLVDEIRLRWRPLISGRKNLPTLGGPPGDFLSEIQHYRLKSTRRDGDDCLLAYLRRP